MVIFLFTPVSLSHGSRSDLPESVHASPICPQTRFKHAQNVVRVSCGYLHADVIAKHKKEARKGRNLLVYNPLKESGLALDLWPSRTRACHLRSYCKHFTDKKRSLYCQLACVRSFLRTWGGLYEDVEGKSLSSCLWSESSLWPSCWRSVKTSAKK